MIGHNRQIGHPRPDLFPILLGHDPGHLRNMAEIVNDPCRQQLTQGDATKAGMVAREVKVFLRQAPVAKHIEVRGSEASEFLQEGPQGALGIAAPVPEPIVGLEGRIRAPGEDDASPGDPVGFLSVDEMPDDVEWAECLGPFRAAAPCLIDVVQKGVQHAGSSSQHIGRTLEMESHARRYAGPRGQAKPGIACPILGGEANAAK
jgi:hypothetical protein